MSNPRPPLDEAVINELVRHTSRGAVQSFTNMILLARAVAPHDQLIQSLPFLPHHMIAKLIESRLKRLYEEPSEVVAVQEPQAVAVQEEAPIDVDDRLSDYDDTL